MQDDHGELDDQTIPRWPSIADPRITPGAPPVAPTAPSDQASATSDHTVLRATVVPPAPAPAENRAADTHLRSVAPAALVEEPRSPGFGTPATMGRRASGYLLDTALGGLIQVPSILAVWAFVQAGINGSGDGMVPAVVLLVCGLVGTLVYCVYQWYLFARSGATTGHRWAGYTLVDAQTGRPPGWGRAAGYHLILSVVAGVTLGIGLILTALVAANHPRRRTWIDRAAGLQSVTFQPEKAHVGRAVLATAVSNAVLLAAILLPVAFVDADPFGGSVTDPFDKGPDIESTDVFEPTDDPIAPDTEELAVSAPYLNLPCSTGKYIVLLASSGDPTQWERTIEGAYNHNSDTQYLRTDRSCEGFAQEIEGNPIYAAYLGPFSTSEEACATRQGAGVGSANVRALALDAQQSPPLCICFQSADTLPDVDTDTPTSTPEEQVLRADATTALRRTGYTDPDNPLFNKVVGYQEANELDPTGVIGFDTWDALLTDPEVCP